MTRTQTFLASTAIALSLPLAALAQAPGTMKCGPEAFSAATMTYTSGPCTGAQASASVGTSGPTAFGTPNSTTMTKAEQKAGQPVGYYAPMPMQAQAVATGPGYAPMMSDQCGSLSSVAITDEYGRKYNCRGDRIGGGRRR
jgi:hypothetical protein